MRAILLFVGWVLAIGAALNAAMAVVALVFIAQSGFADVGMPVDALIANHIPFMAWTKETAAAILPAPVVEFFFATPALIIFPLRAAVAGLLAALALKAALRRG